MPKPVVGIALGAGGARGLANLGVLQVLTSEEIPIDIVTGTSAGAVIAGLYAAGTDLNLLGRMAEELDWGDLTSLTLAKRGLVSSEKIYSMLQMLTKDQKFEDLPIQAGVIAADLLTGQEVVLDSGPVATAIQASLSIPGVFVPVEYNQQLLVDGALVNRVPADLCRLMGADLVIAVDVGFAPLRGRVRNLPDVIIHTIDILQRQVALYQSIDADFLLEPALGNVSISQLNRAAEIIEKGRVAARAVLPELKQRLGYS